VCGSYDQAARGKGVRCFGFLSDDGQWAHCTRDDHAGQLSQNPNSGAYAHKLSGDCGCGQRHDPRPAPTATRGEHRQPVRTIVYEVKDASGQLVAEHLRREFSDGSKSFGWRRDSGPGLGGVLVKDLPLFGIEDLAGAAPAATVVVTEGEKARQSLKGRGILAVATVCGAKTVPDDAQLRPLVAYSPVLWADNDDDGRKHMERIAARLVGLGATPKMVNWPDAQPKGDAADCPGDAAALAQLIAGAVPYVPPPPSVNGHKPDTRPGQTDTEHYTDLGLASRVVSLYGENLRYCWPWSKWLTWTGARWEPDVTGQVIAWTKETVKALYLEAQKFYNEATAAAASGEVDPLKGENPAKAKADALYSWAIKSESAARISAAIDLARSEPGVPVTPKELDRDAWALNVENGTLDLKTGQLRPHRREDMITKLAPVAYNPAAKCPIWLAFLERSMSGKQDLIDFLRRASGYSMTGDVSEHCLFVAYGTGRNGKSTFLNTLLGVLGDYGQKAPPDLLVLKRGEVHPTEKATLFGARFVPAIETAEGKKLDESMVKELTGGDPISTRRMREDFWNFLPTHHLWLATNHKPIISGTDIGIWSRIRMIPFLITIPSTERDKRLKDKLQGEWPGILLWMIHGCLEWQKDGLLEPHEVLQATTEYRNTMDVLGDFLSDRCIQSTQAKTRSADLYESYQDWAKTSGERYLPKVVFGQRLEERGFTPYKGSKGARMWIGIGLLNLSQGKSGGMGGVGGTDSSIDGLKETSRAGVIRESAPPTPPMPPVASAPEVSAEVSANSPCQCPVPEHFAEGEPTPGRCPTCSNNLWCRACGGCIPCGQAAGQQGELGGLPGCPSETESPLMLQSEP
jgi:putative DNA primase/helicase